MDMSCRTPHWVARQLFCDAILSDYLEVARTAAKTVPTLMYVAEHWADVAEPFCRAQFPETSTCVMGGDRKRVIDESIHSGEMEGAYVSAEFREDADEYVRGDIPIEELMRRTKRRWEPGREGRGPHA